MHQYLSSLYVRVYMCSAAASVGRPSAWGTREQAFLVPGAPGPRAWKTAPVFLVHVGANPIFLASFGAFGAGLLFISSQKWRMKIMRHQQHKPAS